MSAIFGAIDFGGRVISDREIEILKNPFSTCKIDRFSSIRKNNVYMACGISFITKESRLEELPYQNKDIFFDADMILDNRSEIGNLLGYDPVQIGSIPDGRLAYEYMVKDENDAINRFLGAYAYVLYDEKKRKASVVIDAVGNRCVYYRIIGSTLYYSSLMKSLEDIEKTEVNERWIADFLYIDSLPMISEIFETPLKDINRVAPGHVLYFDGTKAWQERYWDPIKDVKPIRYSSDEEYKQKFREIFFESVKCVLRSENETSILLSGGYDSTAVAAVAATILDKRNKKLYSYTSVPLKGLETDTRNGATVDETEDVLKTKECYPNIECDFIDLAGINMWDNAHKIAKTLEMPYKSIQNLMWIKEAHERAAKGNSNIILSGEFGNTTISFGDYQLYAYELLHKGKIVSLIKEVRQFCHSNGYDTKYFLKCMVKDVFTKHTVSEFDIKRKAYISDDTSKKNNCFERLKADYQDYDKASRFYKSNREVTNKLLALRQIGEILTKFSLETGVILRDPTKDKRLVEFCMNIPLSQYQKKDEWRRLVSVYLEDIIPKHILSASFKGIQSADFRNRMEYEWNDFISDCKDRLNKAQKGKKLIDYEKLNNDLNAWDSTDNISPFDINRLMYSMLMLEYIEEK